jgi:hypothetical protein
VLVALLEKETCPHKHASFLGSLRFSQGEVWDDIHEVCCECGTDLDHLLTPISISVGQSKGLIEK